MLCESHWDVVKTSLCLYVWECMCACRSVCGWAKLRGNLVFCYVVYVSVYYPIVYVFSCFWLWSATASGLNEATVCLCVDPPLAVFAVITDDRNHNTWLRGNCPRKTKERSAHTLQQVLFSQRVKVDNYLRRAESDRSVVQTDGQNKGSNFCWSVGGDV